MEDLKKQNLEDVAMLSDINNKFKLLKKIINDKEFKFIVNEPVNNLAINFLDEFSKELKKLKIIYKYPDLVYLIFWCRKQKIEIAPPPIPAYQMSTRKK